MAGTHHTIPFRYDTRKMRYDAGSRGWKLADLIAHARKITPHGEPVPTVKAFYDFLSGKSRNPRLAKLLSIALDKTPEHYQRREQLRASA